MSVPYPYDDCFYQVDNTCLKNLTMGNDACPEFTKERLFVLKGVTVRDRILQGIKAERERQIELKLGGDTEEFDKDNSRNDWIAYITTYAGRASDKVSGQNDFRGNLIKTAALCLAALEAYEKRYC